MYLYLSVYIKNLKTFLFNFINNILREMDAIYLFEKFIHILTVLALLKRCFRSS